LPRIDWNRVLIVQLVCLAGILLLVLGWTAIHAIFHTLLLFALAGIVAFMLAPLVIRGEERGLPRPLAVACVYIALATILGINAAFFSRPFVTQATLLVERMPLYVTIVQDQLVFVDQWLEGYGLGGSIVSLQGELTRYVTAGGSLLLGDLIRFFTQVASSALDTMLVLVVSFYLLLDGPRLRDSILTLFPNEHRGKAEFVEEALARVLGGYLRGQLIMAITLAILVGVIMQAIGMPYAVVLGVLAGLFELVPMFGPILSALPALAVALFLPFPMVLWVLGIFFAIQQFESNVLAPRITGHAVGLHPLGAIFALLAGLELGGPLGAVFAVPVAGFLWALVSTLYRHSRGMPEPEPVRRGWNLGRFPWSRAPLTDVAVEASPGRSPDQS
jgi:predicted PurR-regulated permease PerM